MQQNEQTWRPVTYASRSMSETEKRYAQIEKEALAVTWACERFATYILGMKFHIETDHKPLVPLLGTKHLDSLPPRILRFRLRLARFSYTITHIPGNLQYTADTLSRAPTTSDLNDKRLEGEAEALMELSVKNLPASAGTREKYRQAQADDPICSSVITHCQQGWKNRKNIEPDLRPYWKVRSELTVDREGLLLRGKRIVVPKALRKHTLEKIHTGHQGMQRCCMRAKISVWWPGISHDVESMVRECSTCAREFHPRKELMIPTDIPDYPWQKVGTDLFQLKGDTYLLVVDCFSRYPEIKKISSTTSLNIISALKPIFARFGIPETVVSDNGPQYASHEFQEFAKAYDFNPVTSSPLFPQSNGQAERTVQTVKKLLKESSDPDMALLTYRTTPFPWCGLSPAELLMGRRLRANLPLLKEQLVPEWSYRSSFIGNNHAFKNKQRHDYDRHHGVRNLPPIPPGSEVWINTDDDPGPGTVVTPANAPRSYVVETPSGQQIRRNQHHLNVVPDSHNCDQPQQTTKATIMTRSKTGMAINPPERL